MTLPRELREIAIYIHIALLTIALTVAVIGIASALGYTCFRTVHRISILTKIEIPHELVYLELVSTTIAITIALIVSELRRCLGIPLSILLMVLTFATLIRLEVFIPLTVAIAFAFIELYQCYRERVAIGIAIGMTTLCSLSIANWIARYIGIELIPIASYTTECLWLVLGSTTPFLYIAILFTAAIPLLKRLTSKSSNVEIDSRYLEEAIDRSTEVATLLIGIALSVMLYALIYTPLLNPKHVIATTDIIYYTKWLNEMDCEGIGFVLERPDRPLYLLLLYALKVATKSNNVWIATVSGWIWNALLTLSLWYLARELYGPRIAMVVAVIAPLAHQSIAFIYGGFQANHLNLAILYAAIALIVKPTKKRITIAIALLALSIYVHTWSWIHIASAIALYSLIEILRPRSKEIRKYMLYLFVSIPIIALTNEIFLHSISFVIRGAERAIITTPKVPGVGLFNAFSIYLWGAINIPLLYIYALANRITRVKCEAFNVLDSLYIATLIANFFYLNNMTYVMRLILNIPLHIDACKIRLRPWIAILLCVLLDNALRMIYNSVPKI